MSESAIPRPITAVPRARVAVPPWLGLGVLFGLLSVAAIYLYGPIGVSTTYPRVTGALLRAADPSFSNSYLDRIGGALKPETLLVVGLLIGGFLAARLGRGATRPPGVETIHAAEHDVRRRYLNAFFGGALIIFGARLAGGCTSGHIISGITQLAVSGMLFGAAVFASGIATAKLLRGGH